MTLTQYRDNYSYCALQLHEAISKVDIVLQQRRWPFFIHL